MASLWIIATWPNVSLAQFSQFYPSLAHHLAPFGNAARKRSDKGDYWWELRPCSYYHVFSENKIFWSAISKIPRFSFDTEHKYINNSVHFIPTDDKYLLAILQSRVIWFAISQMCVPLRLRAGLWQYQLKSQFISRLPIPTPTDDVRAIIAQLAQDISANAKARYALHERVRRRISQDLGGGGKLNQKLSAWWERDFAGFRAEIHKHWKTDIPLRDRDDWQEWLASQRAKHAQFTAAIIAGETQLNAQVYGLFGLSAAEIALIEASTKYEYGEV